MHTSSTSVLRASSAVFFAALLGGTLTACSSKSGDAAGSASAKATGATAAECKAFSDGTDKADEKAIQLIVPGVTTYADLKKAADEVEEAVKMLTALDVKNAKLATIRDNRKKQMEAFITAARGAKGSGETEVPKDEAEKISKLASAITTGGIDVVTQMLDVCPL